MSNELDEALAFIRSEGERQLREAKDEYRTYAKGVWRDLGLRRPADLEDVREVIRVLNAGFDAIRATYVHVHQAIAPVLRKQLGETDWTVAR